MDLVEEVRVCWGSSCGTGSRSTSAFRPRSRKVVGSIEVGEAVDKRCYFLLNQFVDCKSQLDFVAVVGGCYLKCCYCYCTTTITVIDFVAAVVVTGKEGFVAATTVTTGFVVTVSTAITEYVAVEAWKYVEKAC